MAKTIEDYSYTPPAPREIRWKPAAIVALVLIIIAGFVVWFFKFREISVREGDRVVKTAQPGRIISGFPSGLIPEKGVNIESSYRIDASGVNQPVVTYVSGMSMADNVQAFKNYFETNSWRITADGGNLASPYIYAISKDYTQETNVDLVPENGKVKVIIAVLNRVIPPAQ